MEYEPESDSLMKDHNQKGDIDSKINRSSVLYGVTSYIIVTEFCERLAYYGLAGSLVLFFQTKFELTNAQADIQYSIWAGTCYLTPLLGGYIADTYLGRYKTILIFCIIYLVGLILIVLGSIPGTTNPALIYPAIYIIALGTGGIKPNVSTLGADQFDEKYEQDREEKESFFNWFYWSINIGAAISYIVVSYICQYGIPQLGGVDWGFFVGYMIPVIFLTIAIVIFVLGTPRYRMPPPNGSVIAIACGVCWTAIVNTVKERSPTKHMLDRASVANGGKYEQGVVDSVKLTTRLLPFLLVLVPFWGIYSQMSTGFQNQGCQMNLAFSDKVNVPISALNLFNTIAIVALVPLFDKILYPYLKQKNILPNLLQKISIGFLCAIIAMMLAALIEIYRLKNKPSSGNYYDTSARDNISPCHNIDDYDPYIYQRWQAGVGDEDEPQNCQQVIGCNDYYIIEPSLSYLNLSCITCDYIPQMSNVSIFWQIPQFLLIGVSEIFASISSLEFFYSQAPHSMRSVTQALNLLMTALGAWLIIPLLYIVNSGDIGRPWIPENIDEGHLDWYFFLLACLMFIDLVIFYFISMGYVYMSDNDLSVCVSPLMKLDVKSPPEVYEGAVSPFRNSISKIKADYDGHYRQSDLSMGSETVTEL